jgi:hypothetical protein
MVIDADVPVCLLWCCKRPWGISEAVLRRDSERGRRKLAPVKEKVSATLSSVKSSWAQLHSAVVCAAMVVEVCRGLWTKIVVWEDFGLTGFA